MVRLQKSFSVLLFVILKDNKSDCKDSSPFSEIKEGLLAILIKDLMSILVNPRIFSNAALFCMVNTKVFGINATASICFICGKFAIVNE